MNKSVIFPKLRTIRVLSKMIATEDGLGKTSVADGAEEVFYEVVLDMDEVRCMALRAAASKGQKSSDGPLAVRILKRVPLNRRESHGL